MRQLLNRVRGHAWEPEAGFPDELAEVPELLRPAAPGRVAGPPAGDEADIRVRLLGPFSLTVRGREVPIASSSKGRALVQYLLLASRPVRREVLLDLLWPGYTYQSARNNLNVTLYALRQSLRKAEAASCVIHRDGCYLIDPDRSLWQDHLAFGTGCDRAGDPPALMASWDRVAEAERTLSLYRGPLLEGEPAAEWFVIERRALQERYLALLEWLAAAHLAADDANAAVRMGERALIEDPCRESAHRLMMTCFAALRQRHLVARQFRLCVSSLRLELGITPGAETVRLYRELVGEGA